MLRGWVKGGQKSARRVSWVRTRRCCPRQSPQTKNLTPYMASNSHEDEISKRFHFRSQWLGLNGGGHYVEVVILVHAEATHMVLNFGRSNASSSEAATSDIPWARICSILHLDALKTPKKEVDCMLPNCRPSFSGEPEEGSGCDSKGFWPAPARSYWRAAGVLSHHGSCRSRSEV